MPRASWRGFLRLSLVSCPIYLSPATSRTKSIRLHQVWQPRPIEEPEDELPDHRPTAGAHWRRRDRRLPVMTPALRKIKAARQHGSRSALTILAPARKSRRTRSSRATNTNAASSSRSRRRS